MEQWPCYNYGLLLHNPCVSVDRIVATKKKSRNLSHRDDKQSSDYFYIYPSVLDCVKLPGKMLHIKFQHSCQRSI